MGILVELIHGFCLDSLRNPVYAAEVCRGQRQRVCLVSYSATLSHIIGRKLKKVDFVGSGFILAATTLVIVGSCVDRYPRFPA